MLKVKIVFENFLQKMAITTHYFGNKPTFGYRKDDLRLNIAALSESPQSEKSSSACGILIENFPKIIKKEIIMQNDTKQSKIKYKGYKCKNCGFVSDGTTQPLKCPKCESQTFLGIPFI